MLRCLPLLFLSCSLALCLSSVSCSLTDRIGLSGEPVLVVENDPISGEPVVVEALPSPADAFLSGLIDSAVVVAPAVGAELVEEGALSDTTKGALGTALVGSVIAGLVALSRRRASQAKPQTPPKPSKPLK